ncbi:DUF4465 domain-containing protein [Haloferula sargassicola]|uniref:DUF4465 domain-containing protein n=1 Tax=Haloferula sargassicola TaxID=490096 RepID=A0ABP9UMQ7_9BACT
MNIRYVVAGALAACLPAHAVTITFEDLSPGIAYAGPGGGTYEDGSNLSGSFTSGPLTLPNSYSSTYGSWSQWSYSTTTDSTTPGFLNQFSAYAGSGAAGSSTYVVAYGGGATIPIPSGYHIDSLQITNTTYTGLSMLNGDFFAKAFGGTTGEDPDFFTVTFTGNLGGSPIGSVDFALADFTFTDNSIDYIVAQWTELDLSSLAGADELVLTYASSDVGAYGINTPLYVAIDDVVLNAVPEPAVLLLGSLAPFALLRRRR